MVAVPGSWMRACVWRQDAHGTARTILRHPPRASEPVPALISSSWPEGVMGGVPSHAPNLCEAHHGAFEDFSCVVAHVIDILEEGGTQDIFASSCPVPSLLAFYKAKLFTGAIPVQILPNPPYACFVSRWSMWARQRQGRDTADSSPWQNYLHRSVDDSSLVPAKCKRQEIKQTVCCRDYSREAAVDMLDDGGTRRAEETDGEGRCRGYRWGWLSVSSVG